MTAPRHPGGRSHRGRRGEALYRAGARLHGVASMLVTEDSNPVPAATGGDRMSRLMSASGTSLQFAATQQFGRFRSEADIQRAVSTEPSD